MQSQSDANRSLNNVLLRNIKLQNTLSSTQVDTNTMYGILYDLRNIAISASNDADYFMYMQSYFSAQSNLDAYAAFSADVPLSPA